jgi:hypothetical protein
MVINRKIDNFFMVFLENWNAGEENSISSTHARDFIRSVICNSESWIILYRACAIVLTCHAVVIKRGCIASLVSSFYVVKHSMSKLNRCSIDTKNAMAQNGYNENYCLKKALVHK